MALGKSLSLSGPSTWLRFFPSSYGFDNNQQGHQELNNDYHSPFLFLFLLWALEPSNQLQRTTHTHLSPLELKNPESKWGSNTVDFQCQRLHSGGERALSLERKRPVCQTHYLKKGHHNKPSSSPGFRKATRLEKQRF